MTVFSPILDEVSNPWGAAAERHPTTPPRQRLLWHRLLMGRDGWPFALGVALTVHVGLAVTGLLFYSVQKEREQTGIVLAHGWAADFEGNGNSGTISYSTSAPPLAAMDTLDERPQLPRELLMPPPGEIELNAASASVELDPNWGTHGETPLLGKPVDDAPPGVNFRAIAFTADVNHSAGTGGGSGTSARSGSTHDSPPFPSTGQGHGSSGTGTGDGGGKIGVPHGSISSRGMPIRYPKAAERQGLTGTVTIVFDVSGHGAVTNVRVETSSKQPILDHAASDGVQRWNPPPQLWGAIGVRVPIIFGKSSD